MGWSALWSTVAVFRYAPPLCLVGIGAGLPRPASRTCWILAPWVGGSCTLSTLWAACCWLFPLSSNLRSSSVYSLHFTFLLFFFSLSSCGGGKSYCAVYLFWSGVGSHMSLADFHTSMTVVWIARDYHDIMFTRGACWALHTNARCDTSTSSAHNAHSPRTCVSNWSCHCWYWGGQVLDCCCIFLPLSRGGCTQ